MNKFLMKYVNVTYFRVGKVEKVLEVPCRASPT